MKYWIVYSTRCLRLFFTSSMLASMLANFSLTLSRSNFDIFLIGISVSFLMSSTVISLLSLFLNGLSPFSIVEITSSHVVFSSISLYILFSINILSSEIVCHWFSSSVSWISSSLFKRYFVLSVEILSISLTPRKWGLLSEIIQHNGDIETSHCVNAYSESMLFWIDDPEGR